MQNEPLVSRPRAELRSVEDLVARVQDGRLRLPGFQRPLRWRAEHVAELFDSLWRGYPVGSLLLWRRPAEEADLEIGPLRVHAAGCPDALWVVDGQQRLTALAGVLLHPHPFSSGNDIYALWFDLETQRFVRPAPGADIAPTWLPVSRAWDDLALLGWWSESPTLAGQPELYRTALQLGRRLRASVLPIHVVESDDPDELRTIFARLNTSSVSMRETEVFAALNVSRGQRGPLEVLQDVCAEARMGTLEDSWRLRCLRVVAGERLDTPPRRGPEAYRDVVTPTALALGSALDLLKTACHVPHLRLLPYGLPIVTLTRFLHLHPAPGAQTRILLRRWLWRGIVTQHHRDTRFQQLRWLNANLDEDEAATVGRMLRSCGDPDAERVGEVAAHVARGFGSFNSAEARIYGCLLASVGPRHLETGEALDVGQLLDELGPTAIRKLSPQRRDRIIHPYIDNLPAALDAASPEVRASHLWGRLGDGEAARLAALERAFRDLLLSWCAPGLPDMPALKDLFAGLDEE